MIPLAQAKHVSIDNTVTPQIVHANRESLIDAIGILLDNAIKYSPDKSAIKLTSAANDRYAFLSVIDEGQGLSAEEQEKVFDRFYRADTARSAQHVEGHGLGLSIAKRLVELQHGAVTVASRAGSGSTFTIRLPLESKGHI
jgi:two-component system sensor histidine kinase SenX3